MTALTLLAATQTVCKAAKISASVASVISAYCTYTVIPTQLAAEETTKKIQYHYNIIIPKVAI